MKKTFLAAAIAVMLSAFALKTDAQTKAVFIEDLSSANVTANAKVVLTETPIYNKAGKLLYTVKRYEASSLPKEIDRIVRNQFYDFDILGVEEVDQPSDNNNIYFVHIANDKKLETVKVYDGDTEVMNEYKKG